MRRKRIAATHAGLVSLARGVAALSKLQRDTGLVLVNAEFLDGGEGRVNIPVHFNRTTKEYEIEWSQ